MCKYLKLTTSSGRWTRLDYPNIHDSIYYRFRSNLEDVVQSMTALSEQSCGGFSGGRCRRLNDVINLLTWLITFKNLKLIFIWYFQYLNTNLAYLNFCVVVAHEIKICKKLIPLMFPHMLVFLVYIVMGVSYNIFFAS